MDKDDIIRMAREAGWRVDSEGEILEGDGWHIQTDIVELFAELVAAAERNRTWTQDHWTEYERSIAATEREACAKVAEWVGQDKNHIGIAAAIRARGQE
jgi:hypothetical protein